MFFAAGQLYGTGPPRCVWTGLGRIAVLICHDVEQSYLVDEAVRERAWLVITTRAHAMRPR